MPSDIILVGPPMAGKSTVGKLLAAELDVPQVSLDSLRWQYYREVGYDDALAQEIRQKGGFLAIVAYWSLFNSHAVERILADHSNCVIDFGAGPLIFDNTFQQSKIENVLKPYANVIRLLPSSNLDESIKVLQKRSQHLVGTNAQGFDWSTYFVKHEANRQLAKYEIYTEGKTPAETCAEILKLCTTS